jgi:site-specific DNA-methyltransferase (adenine-specific)
MKDKSAEYLPGVFRCQAPPQNIREHTTQKPIEIIEPLIKTACPGETVLDPFMGSGTTGVACVNLGRKFIGIEIEEKYFDVACNRIEIAVAQGQFDFEEGIYGDI